MPASTDSLVLVVSEQLESIKEADLVQNWRKLRNEKTLVQSKTRNEEQIEVKASFLPIG